MRVCVYLAFDKVNYQVLCVYLAGGKVNTQNLAVYLVKRNVNTHTCFQCLSQIECTLCCLKLTDSMNLTRRSACISTMSAHFRHNASAYICNPCAIVTLQRQIPCGRMPHMCIRCNAGLNTLSCSHAELFVRRRAHIRSTGPPLRRLGGRWAALAGRRFGRRAALVGRRAALASGRGVGSLGWAGRLYVPSAYMHHDRIPPIGCCSILINLIATCHDVLSHGLVTTLQR